MINFIFFHNVFKMCLLQRRQKASKYGNMLEYVVFVQSNIDALDASVHTLQSHHSIYCPQVFLLSNIYYSLTTVYTVHRCFFCQTSTIVSPKSILSIGVSSVQHLLQSHQSLYYPQVFLLLNIHYSLTKVCTVHRCFFCQTYTIVSPKSVLSIGIYSV